ncbi:hypothetical protein Q3G72_009547 [Acer saccharum]|nr:hypothetical protein Q3G72_009547 [Acer saccharum]
MLKTPKLSHRNTVWRTNGNVEHEINIEVTIIGLMRHLWGKRRGQMIMGRSRMSIKSRGMFLSLWILLLWVLMKDRQLSPFAVAICCRHLSQGDISWRHQNFFFVAICQMATSWGRKWRHLTQQRKSSLSPFVLRATSYLIEFQE